MKLSLYQGTPHSTHIIGALETVERCLKGCAALGSDAVLFPELFLTGYNISAQRVTLAQDLDGPAITAIRELAQKYQIAAIIGWPESAGSQTRCHNSATAIGADGQILAHYRKQQLFGLSEKSHFIPGQTNATFDLCNIQTSLLICYDVEFPERVRELARGGTKLILVPTANMQPFDDVSRLLVPARSLENAITIAYCNYCGAEGDLTYAGGSCITDELGQDLARAGRNNSTILTSDLNIGTAPAHLTSTQLQDWQNQQ